MNKGNMGYGFAYVDSAKKKKKKKKHALKIKLQE